MTQPATKRVLIPRDLPARDRVEQALRNQGWNTSAYPSPIEAEQDLDNAEAILLFGPENEALRAELVKKIRTRSPDALVVRMGAASGEADTQLSETSTPEEIAVAVRLGRELRKAHSQEQTLRARVAELERLARERAEAIHDLRKSVESAQQLALYDELTGLYNRRHFMRAAQVEFERAKRENRRVAIAMMDLDNFKPYNDTHGHVKGDSLLRQLAQTLSKCLRRMDTIARYGGDEFIALMPETRQDGASPLDPAQLLERLRRRIESASFQESNGSPATRLTLSAGVGEYPRDAETIEDLIALVDKRLYRAKAAGRNCVCAEGD